MSVICTLSRSCKFSTLVWTRTVACRYHSELPMVIVSVRFSSNIHRCAGGWVRLLVIEVRKGCISCVLNKPQIVNKVIVVRFVFFRDGFIVISCVIITKGWNNNCIGEVLVYLRKSSGQVCFDSFIV